MEAWYYPPLHEWPPPGGSHGKLYRTTKILSHARRRGGGVAARGARAAVEVAAGSVKIGQGLSGPQARLSFPFLQRVERR